MRFCPALSPVSDAQDDFHLRSSVRAVRVRYHNGRMHLFPFRRLPVEDVGLLHSFGSMAVFDAWRANAASAFSHSGSSGSRSITGVITILKSRGGNCLLTSQVVLSNSWMVTAAPGGHSGGMTSRRRLSSVALFIMGCSHDQPPLSSRLRSLHLIGPPGPASGPDPVRRPAPRKGRARHPARHPRHLPKPRDSNLQRLHPRASDVRLATLRSGIARDSFLRTRLGHLEVTASGPLHPISNIQPESEGSAKRGGCKKVVRMPCK